MGTTTSNIGIYSPDPGETNYDAAFLQGLQNIDAHDHSGATNKGVPISTAGISNASVTKEKLATDVVTSGEGLAIDGANPNALKADGLLNSLYKVSSNGILCRTAANTATPRTLTGTSNQITVTNGDGVSGNPTVSLPAAIYTNISFDSGTTTLNNYSTGTFTPVLAFGGGSTGITYATQQAKYWRVGNVIHFNINITLTAKGTDTGDATITGLPVAAASDSQTIQVASRVKLNTYPTGTTYVMGEINAGGTSISIAAAGAANLSAVTDAEFANDSQINLTGFYWVA